MVAGLEAVPSKSKTPRNAGSKGHATAVVRRCGTPNLNELVPNLELKSSQFLLLNEERQYDFLAGSYLPAVEPSVSVPAGEASPEWPFEDDEQKNSTLFNTVRQLKIKFPKPHGKHSEGECANGYFVKVCQHSSENEITTGKVYCHNQDCEVSANRNGNVRFNSLFYGKRESLDVETGELEKLGIAKLAENFDTLWFVATAPKHLHRLLGSVEYLQAMHRAAIFTVKSMLEKIGIPAFDKAVSVPIKMYFHPAGDKNPDEYLPHLNYGVLNCFLKDGKLYSGKRYIPRKWFTSDYFRELYLQKLNEYLGFDIWEGLQKRQLDFNVSVRKKEEPERVMHSWAYFSRIFPKFVRLHDGKRFLPKSLGLLAPANTERLKEVLKSLPEVQRLQPNCGKGIANDPCNFTVLTSVTEDGLKAAIRLHVQRCLTGALGGNNLKMVSHRALEPPS